VNGGVERLTALTAGQQIVFGGNRLTTVPDDLAAAFVDGDRLLVVDATGDLLHVPAAAHDAATAAVDSAVGAFRTLGGCDDDQLTAFFYRLAELLADDEVTAQVQQANDEDLKGARAAGRSTTRLELTASMRADMIEGLQAWRDAPMRRDATLQQIDHGTWSLEARQAPLGVVGFVFEGRPNVVADATGVLRTGNTVAMRIGADALGTATALFEHAVDPALAAAGLPHGCISLVRSPARAAGWALFDDRRLALAVARGSGTAVSQLGAVARQAGTPVSLHGTGGAWIVAAGSADPVRLHAAVVNSLDRKVCNTLNVCCLPRDRPDLVDVFLDALDEAATRRDTAARLHVDESSQEAIPVGRFERVVTITRADGAREEPAASTIHRRELGREWEWEHSPEVSVVIVEDVDEAVGLCNAYSPRFIVSLVSEDAAEHERFYAAVDAPFVGDGFTRWVDGQYALSTPELGLSNWQAGRLLARGGVLSGSSVHTVRYRAAIHDADLRR